MEEKIQSIIEQVKGVHTFSSVVVKINTMLENNTVSIKDIAQEVEKDLSLAANVLRLANSSYYGFSGKVATIAMAMTILGLNTLRNLIMAVSFSKMYQSPGEELFDPAGLWQHSLGCAVSARTLLSARPLETREMAFVCGLLHDIGKVVLAQVEPRIMEAILKESHDNTKESFKESFVDIELRTLGFTHSRIGSALAAMWHFPDSYINAILHHHHSAHLIKNTDNPIGAAVFIGNQLAKMLSLGKSTSKAADVVSDEMWDVIGVPLNNIDELIQEIVQNFSEIKATLDLV